MHQLLLRNRLRAAERAEPRHFCRALHRAKRHTSCSAQTDPPSRLSGSWSLYASASDISPTHESKAAKSSAAYLPRRGSKMVAGGQRACERHPRSTPRRPRPGGGAGVRRSVIHGCLLSAPARVVLAPALSMNRPRKSSRPIRPIGPIGPIGPLSPISPISPIAPIEPVDPLSGLRAACRRSSPSSSTTRIQPSHPPQIGAKSPAAHP